MDGPEIESRLGSRFSAPVHTDPGALLASCTMGTGSFPGVKGPGGGVDHPPRTSAEVEEGAQLYLWAFMACSGANLIFTITFTTLLSSYLSIF